MKTDRSTEIIIKNNIEELSGLYENIELLAEEWEFPPALTMNLNLVMEEAVSNVILYGFDDNVEHDIHIFLTLSDIIDNQNTVKDSELRIVIRDDGKPFDPTTNEDPDVSLAIEDRPVGGLGIFLMRRIMDKVEYHRENNNNILTLIKRIGK